MNKSIFITGGTSGIGKALINQFAKNNYDIFFTYFTNRKEAKSISKHLQTLNVKHDFVKMDLGKISSINNAFNKFKASFKKFSIFINNASPKIERKKFLKLKNKDISKNINSSLTGNIFTLKNALELVLKKKNNSKSIIINISSYSAISGGRDIHLYAAAKAALNTLSIALSKDKYKKQTKIISVVPKYIDTPAFRKNNKIKSKKSFNILKKYKNIKTPSEFAKFIYKKIINSNNYKKPIVYFHTT